MRIRRNEAPILAANVLYLAAFATLSARRFDFEFLAYTTLVTGLVMLVAFTQRRVEFSPALLWGLTLWGCLHMAGGNIWWEGQRLYDHMLVPIITGPNVQVLKYDQFVHALGFGVATPACYHLLRPFLAPDRPAGLRLLALVVLMGMGLGALNEVAEFAVVLAVPETGVGGYHNNALDLVFNMLGALAAAGWMAARGLGRAREA